MESTDARPPWPLLAPLALAPILIAVVQLGRWHPDEVYQFLEPAFFRLHGYGVRAWEWSTGLRNWATPLLFAGLLKLAGWANVEHPHALRAVLALPQLALHLGAVWAAWRYLSRRLDRLGVGWTWFAVVMVAGFGPVLLFSGRTMGESLSASLLLLAAERLDREGAPRRDGLWAGLWLGLSVVVRYGSAVFVLTALVWLLATRRFRLLLWTCVAGAVVAALLGLLDHFTWGRPFHSLLAYAEFNVLSGEAGRRYGEAPWWWYLPWLLLWTAPWAWPGLWVTALRERVPPWGAFAALVYLATISATPHKEVRFLFPATVLLVLAAAPGWVWLLRRVRSARLRVAVAALTLLAGFLPFVDAPDFRGDQFRAQIRATRDDGAKGLLIVGDGLWGSGGYFYMGRNIPLYNADELGRIQQILRGDRRVNRVIAIDDRADRILVEAKFVQVGRIGRERIWVLPEAPSP